VRNVRNHIGEQVVQATDLVKRTKRQSTEACNSPQVLEGHVAQDNQRQDDSNNQYANEDHDLLLKMAPN
jgi:hypothetical protein